MSAPTVPAATEHRGVPVDPPTIRNLQPVALPFPDKAGQLIRHPRTRALAVACNTRGHDSPAADRFPCYAVIEGHAKHRNRMWLTYREALAEGWRAIGDVHEFVTRRAPYRR